MRKTSLFLSLLAFLGLRAEAGPRTQVELDTASVRKFYLEGDFDRAIEDIERALKWDRSFSHQDSVFMFKHLGVMHAAKYETREKGKHYMFQLLAVEPAARILDMYASDMIYMIFKNIQTEFEATQGRLVVDNGDAAPDSAGKKQAAAGKKGRKGGRVWLAWTTGVVAAAGGIALAVHLVEEADSRPRENIPE